MKTFYMVCLGIFGCISFQIGSDMELESEDVKTKLLGVFFMLLAIVSWLTALFISQNINCD